MSESTTSCCSIYSRDGEIERRHWKRLQVSKAGTYGVPTIAGLVPIADVMTRDVICVRDDLPIEKVIELLIHRYIGCVPVVDEQGSPIGMITKRDLLEQLAHLLTGKPTDSDASPVASKGSPRTAEEVMLPLALTVNEHATVLQAAAMMALEDLHHIPVVSPKGVVIGIVSSLDIARWLASNDGLLRSSSDAEVR